MPGFLPLSRLGRMKNLGLFVEPVEKTLIRIVQIGQDGLNGDGSIRCRTWLQVRLRIPGRLKGSNRLWGYRGGGNLFGGRGLVFEGIGIRWSWT